MSRSHFTIEGSWPCFTIATLFNPVVAHDHLSHGGHVQHVLAVVLLGEIDVVEEEGEVFEHPLGRVQHFNKTFLVVLHLGQVHVDGGAHEEAHVEHRLSHLGSNSCWQRSPFQGKKYKISYSPPRDTPPANSAVCTSQGTSHMCPLPPLTTIYLDSIFFYIKIYFPLSDIFPSSIFYIFCLILLLDCTNKPIGQAYQNLQTGN